MNIAVLGYGTVGSGVVEVINTNRGVIAKRAGEPIDIKYVLDLRDFPGDPVQEIIVHDYQVILDDPEVKIVVEVMGGLNPAYTFVKNALLAGKSVCTSNKELVAKHGAELIAIAKEKDINFFFEASVGGAIPIIRPLIKCLTADEIMEISGILNGTTNYMLTKMDREGAAYADVLKEAQAKGYAELHPEADVEGFDACRKIAILTSLACGRQVDFEDIYTEGITKIDSNDFKYAKALHAGIKLLGSSQMSEAGVIAKVSPVMIADTHPLFSVNDVFNAVFVKGNMLDEVMFYGRGAGKLPTASAVVSDIVDAAIQTGTVMTNWAPDKLELIPVDQWESRFLLRISGSPEEKAEAVKAIFGDVEICQPEDVAGEFGVVTKCMTKGEFDQAASKIDGVISRLFVNM